MLDQSKPKITLREVKPRHEPGTGVSLALRDYVFDIEERQVTVEVETSAIQTLKQGCLSPNDVELAAKTLIEIETEKSGLASLRDSLRLNSDAMMLIANRLNWQCRFRSST